MKETETRPQPGNGVLKAVQVSRMVSLRPERVLFYLHRMEGESERERKNEKRTKTRQSGLSY